MKIQYCSDLHLEFRENLDFLKTNPIHPVGDILILAGDIIPFNTPMLQPDFFDYAADNFETTYWLPGNHEYYYTDIIDKNGSINENIRSNVHLVNNTTVKFKNVRLIFSSLWSSIAPVNQFKIQQSISDFHVISYSGRKFTPNHFNEIHKESLIFLASALDLNDTSQNVVVTHHAPTYKNYPQKYKDSPLNDAFVVELSHFIENQNIDSWIYGHTHFNTPDFMIGKTRLLTNQLGYVKYNEHLSFDPLKTIEIK